MAGNTVIVPALPVYGDVKGEVIEVDFEASYPYKVVYQLPQLSGVYGLQVRRYTANELVKVTA